MTDPTITDLARQLAALEERMNTKQAEYESAIDRLRADIANWKTDMANRDVKIILAIVAIVGVAVAFLKYA